MTGRIEISFEEGSNDAEIHIEGVNEIQLFGVAKLLEQTGVEHMARRAMAGQMEALRNASGASEVIAASPEVVRDLMRERNGHD